MSLLESEISEISEDRSEDYRMIDSLHVENFRCFSSLELTDLRRVNLIVGGNASGKTSILEAAKLALDATPQTLPWLNNWRGVPQIVLPNPTPEQFEAAFIDFFHDFDAKKHIDLWFKDSTQKVASVSIYFDPSRAITTQPALGFQPQPTPIAPLTVIPLVFDRQNLRGEKSAPAASINQQGFLLLEPGQNMGISSGLISSSYSGGPGENGQWFSRLSIEKRSEEVVDAVRRHFPFIRNITAEQPTGIAMIYADLPHLPRKLPLSLVSAGISRLFTIVLSLVQNRRGVVFVDEIETGIFHEQYESMWNTFVEFTKRHNTQLFASTHSKECLQAVLPLIEKDDDSFALLRTDRINGSCTVTRISGKMLEDALEQGFDVR